MSTSEQPTTFKAPASETFPATKRKPRQQAVTSTVAAEPLQAPPAASVGRTSKRNQLAALLIRDEGATLDQMVAATSWLPHTVRAAMTGLRKRGYAIDSDKVDGLRTYRAVAPK